jgi:cytosine/adenosine deaminase-related metal-dependent hydrolase
MANFLFRRDFIVRGGACLAGVLAGAGAACSSDASGQSAQTSASRGRRLLLRGGLVLSLDAAVGDFERADVLIEGRTIADVRRDIPAGDAEVVDASNTIVMPGFVDTHRHMWQGALRNSLPDGLLSDYTRDITGAARAVFRPDDARIGNLVTALGALNAGVTTVLDWSHIGNSPEHTDAAIEGLRESGIRAVYAYGPGAGPATRFPTDIRRLAKTQFQSKNGLLTLGLATGQNTSDWTLARDVGALISLHVNGGLSVPEPMMGPDVTYIHCTSLPAEAWKRIAGTGGHVSIAAPIEMEMGHGVPPIQEALDHGIRPSLSVDVETQMPGEFFTQMRSVFTLQRMLALQKERDTGKGPALLTTRAVVEFATIAGARANRLDGRIGTLTPGKDADVIMLRTDLVNVFPLNNVYGAIVQAMDTSNVDTVIVAGTFRKRGGRLVDVDLARVRRMAEASRDYIVERSGLPGSALR